jgi:hypothetical protein
MPAIAVAGMVGIDFGNVAAVAVDRNAVEPAEEIGGVAVCSVEPVFAHAAAFAVVVIAVDGVEAVGDAVGTVGSGSGGMVCVVACASAVARESPLVATVATARAAAAAAPDLSAAAFGTADAADALPVYI